MTTDKAEVRWPSDKPGASFDWYEFSVPGDDDNGELLRVRINVSFLLSSWKCIFGQGCPGVLLSGAMEDRGCCQIGVHMEHSDDDFKRVRGYVNQLTEEDLDANLLKIVKSNGGKGWRYRDTDGEDGESSLPGYAWATKVVDGACVLANRAGGSTGKLGCSLHVLANRLGLHHSDTKPNICWQIPMAVTTEYDEDNDQSTMTVTGTTGNVWGSTKLRQIEHIGWWCTETPDAYVIGNGPEEWVTDPDHAEYEAKTAGMVFRTNEVELRKMMTDRVYDEMVVQLASILRRGGRRVPMPGETIANGRPLLPIMVGARLEEWADEETPESQEALRRSVPYMRKHGTVPVGYRMPKQLTRRRTVEVAQIGGEETIVAEVLDEPQGTQGS